MVVSSEQQQKDYSHFDLEPRFVDRIEAYMEQITNLANEMWVSSPAFTLSLSLSLSLSSFGCLDLCALAVCIFIAF